MSTDLTLTYSLQANELAHVPFLLNTVVGAYRIVSNLIAVIYHVALRIITKDSGQWAQVKMDIRGICRGIVELTPILGAGASILWDKYMLTESQKVAYKIQEFYRSRFPLLETIDERQFPKLSNEELLNASDEFRNFVNNQPINISHEENKIKELENAYYGCNFDHPIFADKNLPFYAMGLFYRQKIKATDMATLLYFYGAKQFDNRTALVSIFEKEDKLNEMFNVYMQNPAYEQTFIKHEFNNGVLKALKALRSHQRIMIVTPSLWDHKKALQNQDAFYSGMGFLNAFGNMSGLIRSKEGFDCFLSLDAFHSFMYVNYPNSAYAQLEPKLGKFSTREVRAGVKRNVRLCSLYYPGLANNVRYVHNSLELPHYITGHDHEHAEIMNMYPLEATKLMLDLSNSLEEVTGFEMSKEIWELTDMVVSRYLKFCIRNDFSTFDDNFWDAFGWKELFFEDNGEPTVLGWLAVFYIYEKSNSELFKRTDDKGEKKFEISESMFNPYIDYWKAINKNNQINKTDSKKVKIWKMQHPGKVVPSELEFYKVRSGSRKNTIRLRAKPS